METKKPMRCVFCSPNQLVELKAEKISISGQCMFKQMGLLRNADDESRQAHPCGDVNLKSWKRTPRMPSKSILSFGEAD